MKTAILLVLSCLHCVAQTNVRSDLSGMSAVKKWRVSEIDSNDAKFAPVFAAISEAYCQEHGQKVEILQSLEDGQFLAKVEQSSSTVMLKVKGRKYIDGQEFKAIISSQGEIYQYAATDGAKRTVAVYSLVQPPSPSQWINLIKAKPRPFTFGEVRVKCNFCYGKLKLQNPLTGMIELCPRCNGNGVLLVPQRYLAIW